MSDDIDHIAPEDEGRVLAAEYVLGVLSAEERRTVETRMAEEASFAREVAGWEERLGGMASYVHAGNAAGADLAAHRGVAERAGGSSAAQPGDIALAEPRLLARPSASALPRWPPHASPALIYIGTLTANAGAARAAARHA